MEVVDWFTGNVSESSCASSPGLCRIIKRPLLSGCCYVIKLFWASLGTDLLHSARRSWFSRAVKLKVVRTCSWCRVVTTWDQDLGLDLDTKVSRSQSWDQTQRLDLDFEMKLLQSWVLVWCILLCPSQRARRVISCEAWFVLRNYRKSCKGYSIWWITVKHMGWGRGLSCIALLVKPPPQSEGFAWWHCPVCLC